MSFEKRSPGVQWKAEHEPSHPRKDSGQLLSGFKEGLGSPLGKKISPRRLPAWPALPKLLIQNQNYGHSGVFSSIMVSFFYFLSLFLKVLNRKSGELGPSFLFT